MTTEGCKYEFVQGAKKGTICQKSCRGDFCRDHKPKRKQAKAKYYREKKASEKDHEIKEAIMKIKEIKDPNDLPDIVKQQLRLNKLRDKQMNIFKTLIGIKVALGHEDAKKYLIKKQEQLEKLAEAEIFDDLGDTKDISVQLLKEHFILCMPSKQPYFEFNGSKENAKKKLKKLTTEFQFLNDKIENAKIILETISLQEKKLKKLRNYARKSPQERYYEKNKSTIQKQQKDYRLNNKSKIDEYQKEYRGAKSKKQKELDLDFKYKKCD